MRPFRHLALALVVFLLGAHDGRGDDGALDRARSAFDAIVRAAAGGDRPLSEPSLTALVRAFLSFDPEIVLRVEAEALEASRRSDRGAWLLAVEVEETIRFLHDLPPGRSEPLALESFAGAVVRRRGVRPWLYRWFTYWGYVGLGNRQLDPHRGCTGMTFWDLVGDSVPRPSPAPDAEGLLACALHPGPTGWWGVSDRDLGTAIGELCATDDRAFGRLMGLAFPGTRDTALILAVGRSPQGFTAHWLTGQVRRLADGYDSRTCAALAESLEHVDPRAFRRLLADLPPAVGEELLASMGGGRLIRARLEAIDGAADGDARREALLRLCALPVSKRAAFLDLPARDVAPLYRALRAAKALFRLDDAVAPYVEALLHRLVFDLDGGRLVPEDDPLGIFDAVVPEVLDPGRGASLDVTATWRADGLAIGIHNRSDGPVALDPVSPGYFLEHRGAWNALPSYFLFVGVVPFPATVPSSCLLVLGPGDRTEFLLPLPAASHRPEVRRIFFTDHALWPRVTGTCPAPLFRIRQFP
ncbi:MAG: hypothetical protein MUE73_06290 [Planctomycetes bacterium]|nr:hypothetical protein [Planctomycetota bacterium]